MARTRVVLALGSTQTLGYASSWYLPAILAGPVALALDVPAWTLFACLSGAMVVAGLLAPYAGALVDRGHGRLVLAASSVVLALGLALLAAASGPLGLIAAWLVIGAGMAGGLYEVAFASLARLYGQDARSAITGVTLIAGFASTIGWPAMAGMEAAFGWRATCLGWAAIHLCLGLPLHLGLPGVGRAVPGAEAAARP